MTQPHRSTAGQHTLVLDLGAADGPTADWVAQRAALGERLVLAVRQAGQQRDWMPLARRLGVPVLAPPAGGGAAVAAQVRQALLPLGDRVDRLVLVLDLPLPAAAAGAAAGSATWARGEVETCLQALQQGCIRLAELAHWCEPALRAGSQVRVLPRQLGHPALRQAGLDTALALSVSSTLRYLAHGLGPRGVQVDLLTWPAQPPGMPPQALTALAEPQHRAARPGTPAPPRGGGPTRPWRLGRGWRPQGGSAPAPSTLPPLASGATRPPALP